MTTRTQIINGELSHF